MKKALALVLALVLCLGIFAGCNTDEPVDTTPSTNAPDTTTEPATETTTEPVETEYTFPEGSELWILSGHDINDLPLDQFIEDATGINIKWTPKGTDDELTNMMTQKVTPSLIFQWGMQWGHEMGRYGALVNLWEYRDIMPNFFKYFDAAGDAIKKEYMTSEDELYSAPIWTNGDAERCAWMYREDIFAELNLSVPTNWEELLNVCKVLKEAYPDSYPICMRNMGTNMLQMNEFAPQFGVDYAPISPSLDRTTGTYYNAYTTDAARTMLKMLRTLIEEGYMDIAVLSYSTADWVADMSTGKSFITHDKAWQLDTIEKTGKEMDENFSLRWFNNMPLVESDLPYQGHTFNDYGLAWNIASKCEDVELAVRYLDWLYSEEGSLIMSWGVQGESYDVDENGKKYFLEGYDTTYQARYQEAAYIDFAASVAQYTDKCQEMMMDTIQSVKEGNNWAAPSLVFTADEQAVLGTYMVDWYTTRDAYWQKFLLGTLDIDSDADWQEFKDMEAGYGEAEILAIYNAAQARYDEG